MSHRTLESKAARREERRARKDAGALPRRVNLIDWVRARGSFSRRTAAKIVLSGALKVDSHTVGVTYIDRKDKEPLKILNPIIDADLARKIQIVMPEALRDS